MRVERHDCSSNIDETILKAYNIAKYFVSGKRGVEVEDGRILSHNAYLAAHLGSNASTTFIELRAENNNRVLAAFVFGYHIHPSKWHFRDINNNHVILY